ncbi:MAG: DUF1566 domain-containing protein [Chloroflexota bacterium]
MKRNLAISWAVILVLTLVVALPVVGWCGKSSSVKGKVVDGVGKPLAGLKIIARQVQPIKGYEQFDTVAGADGTFKLRGLHPMSKYVLVPWSKEWTTEARLEVETWPSGETYKLPQPLVILTALSREGGSLVNPATGKARFSVSAEGVIRDSQTGLEWAVGPDKGVNYKEAEAWVKGCKIAGGGWRMPTGAELRSIYAKGLGERNMDPTFKTTGKWVWAVEHKDSSSALPFDFRGGGTRSGNVGSFDDIERVFGVRSTKK